MRFGPATLCPDGLLIHPSVCHSGLLQFESPGRMIMKRMGAAFWADEIGFILSAELVLIATVAVLGLTTLMVGVRNSIGGELTDLSNAFRHLDQSYAYGGMLGCPLYCGYASWTAGSKFLDGTLREAGSEQDLIVADHIVGTGGNGISVPATRSPFPMGAAPMPMLPAPHIPLPNTSVPDGNLPVPKGNLPCPHCSSIPNSPPRDRWQEDWPSQGNVLPPPSSDIPPQRVWNRLNRYSPPFSQPIPKMPAGPLQVW